MRAGLPLPRWFGGPLFTPALTSASRLDFPSGVSCWTIRTGVVTAYGKGVVPWLMGWWSVCPTSRRAVGPK